MNIGEIARQAGVSRSTVSYVLSGKRQIGEQTRQRVMAIIEQASYVPSATARALAQGATSTLALVVPPLHHHLNIEIMSYVGAIAEVAAEHDYDTLLSASGGDRPEAFPRLIRERRVDGVVLMETRREDDRVALLLEHDFPFVTIGRTGFDDRHDWVDTDYPGLIREAVRQFAAAGHRHVALVDRPRDLVEQGYNMSVITTAAFREVCAELGLTPTHVYCDEDDDAATACVAELFAADPDVTAVITVNDRSLNGLVTALVDAGRRIPEDVSVMAVAADRIAAHTAPPVTAADLPALALARAAVDALIGRLASRRSPFVNELIRPSFTDRGSVRSARTG